VCRSRQLEPAIAQGGLGGEGRDTQDAIEIVAPPGLERGQEHGGPIGDGRRHQALAARGTGDRPVPAAAPAPRNVEQELMERRRVVARSRNQSVQALSPEQSAHHPPHPRPIHRPPSLVPYSAPD
jgi:hypothetical protein